jgi:hypothetical protein
MLTLRLTYAEGFPGPVVDNVPPESTVIPGQSPAVLKVQMVLLVV